MIHDATTPRYNSITLSTSHDANNTTTTDPVGGGISPPISLTLSTCRSTTRHGHVRPYPSFSDNTSPGTPLTQIRSADSASVFFLFTRLVSAHVTTTMTRYGSNFLGDGFFFVFLVASVDENRICHVLRTRRTTPSAGRRPHLRNSESRIASSATQRLLIPIDRSIGIEKPWIRIIQTRYRRKKKKAR